MGVCVVSMILLLMVSDVIKLDKKYPVCFHTGYFMSYCCVLFWFYALMLCVAAQYISVLFGIAVVHEMIPRCASLVDAYRVPVW